MVPDADHSAGEFDRAELIRPAQFLPQIAPFRSGCYYNNAGLIIAGEIIERVAGRSWAEVVRDRILRPLEMSSTVPDVLELKGVKNVATSYVSVNEAQGTATRVQVLGFGKFGVRVLGPPRDRCGAMPLLPALGSCHNRHLNNTLGPSGPPAHHETAAGAVPVPVCSL
jgi:CubicO group peptidase (beta-lactamase class C family)